MTRKKTKRKIKFENGKIVRDSSGNAVYETVPADHIAKAGRHYYGHTRDCAECGTSYWYERWGSSLYCSDACKQAAYRKRKKGESPGPKFCPVCEENQLKPRAKYCSPACKQKAYRQRQAES